MSKEFETYNDGVVSIYREKAKETDFNAKRNVLTLDDMDFIVKLNFKELSKREQDLEFAQQNDFTLSLKIKSRLVKGVDNKCNAVIDGFLYDVSFVDKTKNELFLYMEQIRKVGESN